MHVCTCVRVYVGVSNVSVCKQKPRDPVAAGGSTGALCCRSARAVMIHHQKAEAEEYPP